MSTIIVRHKNWFFLWSTNSDSLASSAMSREEMEELLLEDAIEEHKRSLALRMDRVMEFGTSSRMDDSAEDTCSEFIWDEEAAEADENYHPPRRPYIDILREAGIPEEDL